MNELGRPTLASMEAWSCRDAVNLHSITLLQILTASVLLASRLLPFSILLTRHLMDSSDDCIALERFRRKHDSVLNSTNTGNF
jgi:hypothetical protein